jgi:hypothetical protein
MKYAVIVKAISPNPWTEQVRDTREEAIEVKQFIEAHLRGVTVWIEAVFEEPATQNCNCNVVKTAPPRSYRH